MNPSNNWPTRAYPNRSNDPIVPEGVTLTAKPLPVDYHEIVGNPRFEREEIVVDPDFLTRTGLPRRRQVRLTNPLNGVFAIYTIAHVDRRIGDPTAFWIGPDGYDRLGLSSDDAPFEVKLSLKTVDTGLSVSQAQQQGELVEELFDDGVQTDMIVVSPHGGNIEIHTSELGQRLHDQLQTAGKSCTFWTLQGYNATTDPVGAFHKWHVTSVDIYPPNYPELNSIIARDFSYALSFHGYGSGDAVEIGGTADSTMKNDVKAVIEGAVGNEVSVSITQNELIGGDASRNVTNRLSPNGTTIQLEMGLPVRENYGNAIADALANHYAANVLP